MALENHTTESYGKWVGDHLLFNDALESDKRVPCVIFSVPGFLLRLFHNEEGGDKLGLLAPQLEFWIALGMTLILGAIFNSCISYVVYHFIVLPQKQSSKKGKQSDGSRTPFLVGFGLIMPLCAFFPYYMLPYFHIKNKIIKFLTGTAQLTSFFRCSEAMFGFLPSGVDESLKTLMIYSAFPVEIKYDSNGATKSTLTKTKHYFINWIKYMVILGMCNSIMSAYDYEPYPNEEGPALLDINILHGFTRGQLINNLSVAIMFQIYLTTFGFGLNFIVSVVGFEQIPMMLNPIFESTSVSDFWGRRWNLVVHGILKRGVYKPVRTKYSRFAASTASFLASGFFHEWLLSVVFSPDSDDGTCSPMCYKVGYGRNTLFFVWNAILIGFEYALGGAAIFQLFRRNLPVPVFSLLVASTALPAVHWFTNDYVRTDFFRDAQTGFPLLVRVSD